MTSLRAAAAASLLALALAGCGPNLCDRSKSAAEKTAGNCGDFAAPLLGASCSSSLSQCTDADQQLLTASLTCAEKIAQCNLLTKDAWKLQRDACTTQLSGLTPACADAFFEGTPPGVDAGLPDAGLWPVTDGGNGLVLSGAANQDTIALAWEPRRYADVARWYLVETDGLGENRVETELTPGTLLSLVQPDAGTARRRFFIAGLNAGGELLTGTAIAETAADAGMCMGPNDCPDDEVCDLGQCKVQTCQFQMANTCPSGYQCFSPGLCRRTTADGGIFTSGGRRDAGVTPLPMLSNEIDLTPRPPMPRPVVSLGTVAARRPDIAAFDTARVAVAIEQEGQLICHASAARGTDFFTDEGSTSFGLDTVGTRVHLAWSQESGALYACYVVGRGVRIQKSDDRGRTWGRVAKVYEPPVDDAGVGEIIRDCDLAPWKNGGVVMVTAEEERLVLREFDQDLQETAKSNAFISTPADAGVDALFNPSHPAIAALPSTGLVHVTFTGSRFIGGGVRDTEPYGVFREGSSTVFSNVSRLTPTLAASPLPEDWTTVAIHPRTGRAVGAYTTVETNTQNSTVYVALFSSAVRSWSTGSHLNVLGINTQMNVSLWLPQKAPTERWFAFSPQFAPLPDGTFAFSFVAGPHSGMGGDYRLYMVPFDLERVAATTTARGWYVPPVMQMSTERVLDPRGTFSAPQPPVSALTADGQISVYGAFITGGGINGDTEGPAQYFSWP